MFLTCVRTLRNILDGMVCTSSNTMMPHSCSWIHFMVCSASQLLFWVWVIMLKVVIRTEHPMGLSLASEVNLPQCACSETCLEEKLVVGLRTHLQIMLSSAVLHILN